MALKTYTHPKDPAVSITVDSNLPTSEVDQLLEKARKERQQTFAAATGYDEGVRAAQQASAERTKANMAAEKQAAAREAQATKDALKASGNKVKFTDEAKYPGVSVEVPNEWAYDQKLNALREEANRRNAFKGAEGDKHYDEAMGRKTNPPKEADSPKDTAPEETPTNPTTPTTPTNPTNPTKPETPKKPDTPPADKPPEPETPPDDKPATPEGDKTTDDKSAGEQSQGGNTSFSFNASGMKGTMGAAMRGLMGLNRDHTYDEMAAKHDIQAGQADARARKARANADVDINAAAANDAMTKAAAAQMSAGLTNGSAGVANALETNAQINPLETQQLQEQRRQAYTEEAHYEDAGARNAEQSAAYERRQGLTASEDRANAAAQDADAQRIDAYIKSMIANGQATVMENKDGQQYVVDDKGTKIAVAGSKGRWEPTAAFDDSHISLTATKTETETKVTQDVNRLPNLDLSLAEYQALYNLASGGSASAGQVSRVVPKIPADKQEAVLEAIKKNDGAHNLRLSQLRKIVSTAPSKDDVAKAEALQGKEIDRSDNASAPTNVLVNSPGGRLPVVHLVPDANGAYTFRNTADEMLQEYISTIGRDEYTKNAAGKYVGTDGKEAVAGSYNNVKSDQEMRVDEINQKVADGSYQVEDTASKYQLARDDKGSIVAYRQAADKPWQLATKQDLTPGSWMYSLRKPNSSELISITAAQQ